jgi:hypothetical protein
MLDFFQHSCIHYSQLHTEDCMVTGWKSFLLWRASASESEDTHQTQSAVTNYKKTLKLLASLRLYNYILRAHARTKNTHKENKKWDYWIKLPTRCTINIKFYCLVACTPLNMFRALLCSSSRASSNCPCSLWLPYDCRVGRASKCVRLLVTAWAFGGGSWWWAQHCPKHVERCICDKAIKFHIDCASGW